MRTSFNALLASRISWIFDRELCRSVVSKIVLSGGGIDGGVGDFPNFRQMTFLSWYGTKPAPDQPPWIFIWENAFPLAGI